MLKTNEIRVEFDYDAIDRDFDIYIVETTSDDYKKTNILDIPTDEFKAKSVQYSYGKKSYVLFGKHDVKESEFRRALQSKFDDVTVSRVRKSDLLDEEFCNKNFYTDDYPQNRYLTQLLLNSIRVPTTEGMRYNNLTGKLYYGPIKEKKSYKQLVYLEVKLEEGMNLNLKVNTFSEKCKDDSKKDDNKVDSEKKSYYKREYVIDPNSGMFRKRLKTDSKKLKTYILRNYTNEHNKVPFLDLINFAAFKNCKLGVMQKFIIDIKRYLGKYMTLALQDVHDSKTYKAEKIFSGKKKEIEISKKFGEKSIVIVNTLDTERSKVLADEIKCIFDDCYGISAEIGELNPEKYNIRIIEDAVYYTNLKLPDPHAEDLGSCVVQHMTPRNEFF
jgi:hypothetical protein